MVNENVEMINSLGKNPSKGGIPPKDKIEMNIVILEVFLMRRFWEILLMLNFMRMLIRVRNTIEYSARYVIQVFMDVVIAAIIQPEWAMEE